MSFLSKSRIAHFGGDYDSDVAVLFPPHPLHEFPEQIHIPTDSGTGFQRELSTKGNRLCKFLEKNPALVEPLGSR